MSHANIPVFVPHLACPNRCVFCDQQKIAGTKEAPVDPKPFLEKAVQGLQNRFDTAEIAFFGGSFTAIPRPRMEAYLQAASPYRKSGQVTGIRLSTRPDAISREIAAVLHDYGVTAVELGVQSLDDQVLHASNRGHTAEDTLRALEILREYPFEVVFQLMPGLPEDTPETVAETFAKAVALHPDAVRLYPCLVIKETPLARMYENGTYTPLSLDTAIQLCADGLCLFRKNGIRILRMGLHGSDLQQSDSILAGPFHPAFGELVTQEVYYRTALRLLDKSPDGDVTLLVKRGCLSKLVGQKRANLKKLGPNIRVAEHDDREEIMICKTKTTCHYETIYT